MEGVIDQLVNTAGASEQYPDLQCLRNGLGHRPRGSQASEALVSASRENCTQSQTPARAKSQASGDEQEIELEEANTQNDQAPRSQAALDKACQKVIPDQSGVDFSQTSVEKLPVP